MRSAADFAIRTLLGPWLAVVAVILEVVNSLQRGRPWVGEGLWTVEWFGIVLFILGPLAAGVTAVDAARLSRAGSIHLVVATPRPWLPYLRAVAWCVLPICLVHLGAIAVGLVQGRVLHPSAGWAALLVGAGVQCAVLVWYAALGSALGRFLHPVAAGLGGSMIGFALAFVLSDAGSSGRFALLDVGAATVSRLGLTYNYAYLGGQALLLVGTAALLIVVPTRAVRAIRVPTLTGAGVAVIAVLGIVVGIRLLPADRLQADPQRPSYCIDRHPRICLYEEHRRYAGDVVANVDRLVTAARKAGYSSLVPQEIVESSRTFVGARPLVPTLLLPLDPSHGSHLRLDDWVEQLIYPLQCAATHTDHAPPPETFFRRLELVEVTWLHLAGIRSDLFDFGDGLRVLDPAQTAAIIREFAACDLGG